MSRWTDAIAQAGDLPGHMWIDGRTVSAEGRTASVVIREQEVQLGDRVTGPDLRGGPR